MTYLVDRIGHVAFDVRDLAAFLLLVAERNVIDTFNACGPAKKMGWGEMLTACKAACPAGSPGRDATLTWVPTEFLIAHPEQIDLPLWVPYQGDSKGFHTWSNARAVKAGLKFRPIEVTCRDTLEWWPTELERRVRVTNEMQEEAKAKGDEPPIEGYAKDDAFKWCIDSIEQCIPHAEQAGVVMAIENHWGLTTQPNDLLRIYHAVRSPWLGMNVDTGNYVGDPYPQMELLAPHATIVQAKTYYGGGVYYTRDLDYNRIAKILRDAGFKGYVSLEMEGKEAADTAVPKSLKVLRDSFAA